MLVIDRIEGEWAVVEYGSLSFNLPLPLLPKQVQEGDVINLQITILGTETKKRAESIDRLSKELFE